jgi:hypothetical protein
MRPHFKILIGTLAIGIPIAAAAQMSGQYGQQGAAKPAPAQSTTQQSDTLKPATSADIKAGATIYDQKGGTVGKVDSVDAEGVVISTGSARAKVPLSTLGIGSKGLTMSVDKAELEAAVAKKQKEEKPQ